MGIRSIFFPFLLFFFSFISLFSIFFNGWLQSIFFAVESTIFFKSVHSFLRFDLSNNYFLFSFPSINNQQQQLCTDGYTSLYGSHITLAGKGPRSQEPHANGRSLALLVWLLGPPTTTGIIVQTKVFYVCHIAGCLSIVDHGWIF